MSLPNYSILPAIIFKDLTFLKKISVLGEFGENYQNLEIDFDSSGKSENYGDRKNEYKLNTLGYRSKEIKKVPVVFAGCSITFGVGVPIDGVWSTIVGEELGVEYINLGVPGWSPQAIVDNLFKYFYKFGNPEIVFVTFPDYHRMILTSNRSFCRVEPHSEDDFLVKVQDAVLPLTPTYSRKKYAKKPYQFTDFITPEYALLQAFRSINSLITYCKGANIKLVWSTWDSETNEIIDIVKNTWNSESYSGYVHSNYPFNGDLNKNELIDENYSGCHGEYISRYQENFFTGADDIDKNKPPHPGVHYHLHLAETMLKGLKNLK
jgi:hypothetical protein